ncbi:hypothetical protein ILYODFUR_037300 [Ilyodon furcidens]|uniref:Uncharacterized protein n=1 Tax=Ilyodon furcidens TaxID=33524 RepID=A0ABV0V9B0_9TELE
MSMSPSVTDQRQGGGFPPLLHPIHFIITGTGAPVVEADGMLVVSVVMVDGVEHPEEGVEPAGHWEMCATTAVSLDIGHAPALTGGHSREYQDLQSLLMEV